MFRNCLVGLIIVFFKKAKFVSSKSDSFTLSNKKLLKKIKFKIKKRDLEIFCKKIDLIIKK